MNDYIFNPDCEAEYPCWQHHAEHHNTQPPVRWVIDLAEAVVSFRLRALQLWRNDDAYWKVYEASQSMHALINERWRNIHFAPFKWKLGEGAEFAMPELNEGIPQTLQDLLASLPPTLTTAFKRRF